MNLLRRVVVWWLKPGYLAVGFHRLCHYLWYGHTVPSRLIGRAMYVLLGPIVEVWTGVTLPPQTTVVKNLRLHHRGKTVINEEAIIGDDCVIVHGVTIGNTRPGGAVPRIGNRVTIGAYAQILGGVVVGDDVRIGAMALVVEDVPSGATVVAPKATMVTRGSSSLA